MTATTALTVQNTHGVLDVHPTPPAFVEKQINACIDDIGVDVVKCGMTRSCLSLLSVPRSLLTESYYRHAGVGRDRRGGRQQPSKTCRLHRGH